MPALLPIWAATGTIVAPDASKISVGWLLGEKPPHEHMNWWQNLATQRINHVLLRGTAEWDFSITYGIGALIKTTAGLLYRALSANTNRAPATNPNIWLQVTENASALATGTVPNARLAGAYTGITTLTMSGDLTVGGAVNVVGNLAANSFAGAGTNLTALNASSLASGTVHDDRMSGDYSFGSLTLTGNLSVNGALTVASTVTSGGGFIAGSGFLRGSTTNVVIGPNSADLDASAWRIYLRPKGYATGDNQVLLRPGEMNLNGNSLTGVSDLVATGAVSGASFSGGGAGLTGLNASALAAGSVPNARMNGAYSFASLDLSGGLTAGGSLVTAGNVGSDGGIIYVGSTEGYFRAPVTANAALYTFQGNTGTGMGRAGANVLSFYTDFNERLRISAAGSLTLMDGGVYNGNGSGLSALNAGELASGTVPAGRLGATTADNNWVSARYGAVALSSVGMVAFASDKVDRATSYGTIRPGADLVPANSESNAALTPVFTGTWRCLGRTEAGADRDLRATLWQRVT